MLSLIFLFITSSYAEVISTPEKCLETKSYPCVILTKGKTTVSLGENGFYLASNSMVSVNSPDDVFVVRGHMWGVAKKAMHLHTQFGRFDTEDSGSEYWMSVNKETSTIKMFYGVADVTPKGGESVFVTPGRQVQLSAVDYTKKSCFASNVSVFDFQQYVREYGRVFPYGAVSVEEHLQKVAGAVLTASFQDSAFLRKNVARQLASDIARDIQLKAQREEASRLEIYLRKLFRIKSNFEDQ